MHKISLFGKETVKLNCIDCLLVCYVIILIISLCIHPEGFNLFVLSKGAIGCFAILLPEFTSETVYIMDYYNYQCLRIFFISLPAITLGRKSSSNF